MSRYKGKHKFEKRTLIAIIFSILGLVILSFLFISDKKKQDEYATWAEQANKEEKQKRVQEELASKEQEANDSFYQKLVDGYDVNILVVGDSIGAGDGASDYPASTWYILLQQYIFDTYGIGTNITNVSMGGNTSYAGYVRTMLLEDDAAYDLAIICYGQNDEVVDFSLYYESIVRAIRKKYDKCSIISVLESSQGEYTEKIKTIQSLAKHYNIAIADTIAAFNNSNKEYGELTDDGIHPNDDGYMLYFETLKEIVDSKAALYEEHSISNVSVVNADVTKFDELYYLSADDFTKAGDFTYEITIENRLLGVLGIYSSRKSGENRMEIYIDDEIFFDSIFTFDYDFSQSYISVISDDCAVEQKIKIVFSSKEVADSFEGLTFSNKK